MAGISSSGCWDLTPTAGPVTGLAIDADGIWTALLVDLDTNGWHTRAGCSFFIPDSASDSSGKCTRYSWQPVSPQELCCWCGGGSTVAPPPSPPPAPCFPILAAEQIPAQWHLIMADGSGWAVGFRRCDYFSSPAAPDDACTRYAWQGASPIDICCECGGGTLGAPEPPPIPPHSPPLLPGRPTRPPLAMEPVSPSGYTGPCSPPRACVGGSDSSGPPLAALIILITLACAFMMLACCIGWWYRHQLYCRIKRIIVRCPVDEPTRCDWLRPSAAAQPSEEDKGAMEPWPPPELCCCGSTSVRTSANVCATSPPLFDSRPNIDARSVSSSHDSSYSLPISITSGTQQWMYWSGTPAACSAGLNSSGVVVGGSHPYCAQEGLVSRSSSHASLSSFAESHLSAWCAPEAQHSIPSVHVMLACAQHID